MLPKFVLLRSSRVALLHPHEQWRRRDIKRKNNTNGRQEIDINATPNSRYSMLVASISKRGKGGVDVY